MTDNTSPFEIDKTRNITSLGSFFEVSLRMGPIPRTRYGFSTNTIPTLLFVYPL